MTTSLCVPPRCRHSRSNRRRSRQSHSRTLSMPLIIQIPHLSTFMRKCKKRPGAVPIISSLFQDIHNCTCSLPPFAAHPTFDVLEGPFAQSEQISSNVHLLVASDLEPGSAGETLTYPTLSLPFPQPMCLVTLAGRPSDHHAMACLGLLAISKVRNRLPDWLAGCVRNPASIILRRLQRWQTAGSIRANLDEIWSQSVPIYG